MSGREPGEGSPELHYDEAVRELVEEQELPERESRVLEMMVLEPFGLEASAAESILASALNTTTDECADALRELLGRHLVVREEENKHARLRADYDAISVPAALREKLAFGDATFERLGPPHGPKALDTLESWFKSSSSPLYVGLEITSHKIFRDFISTRAEQGHMTYFLMPARAAVPVERRPHHDDVLRGWIDFLKSESKKVRDFTRLLFTDQVFPHLYTGGISPESVRFDLYWVDEPTTRKGILISSPRGTSLYELLSQEYARACAKARPCRKVWFGEWAAAVFRQNLGVGLGVVLLVLTGILLILDHDIANVAAAVVGGVGGGVIVDQMGVRRWQARKLFAR